jgi:DNA-binding MarR family transcriptional regulator
VPVGGHVNVALQAFRVNHLIGLALDEALKPIDLDGEEFAVLSVLRVVQPVQAPELADILKLPKTLPARLAKLERRRLVRHRLEKSSGRAKLYELTALGDRKVQACYPIFGQFVQTIEAELGERLAAVQDALGDLERVLEDTASERHAPAHSSS